MGFSKAIKAMDVKFLRQFLADLRKKLQSEEDAKKRKKIEKMIRLIEAELISRL